MIHRIMVGHMLGDGHIAKVDRGNSYFVVHRKAKHHEYNLWTKNILLNNGFVVTDNYPKIGQSYGSNNFPSSYLRTGRDKFWSEQRSLWYKDGRKTLPRKYIEKNFDNLSFLLWFLDDGDSDGRISTDCFLRENVMFLRDFINQKYGIRFNIQHQHNRPQHIVLRCPKKKRDRLFAIFQSPSISIPCMSYKLNWT
ncbi:hypothetical protein KJ841_00360 [Patescibacteria group bacterium]|nr:hypothetical protein [Patescibacteria group bacterium]